MKTEAEIVAAPGIFLAERLLEEATRRGVPFNPAEVQYLLLAGDTDEAAADKALEQLEDSSDYEAEEFEERVSALVSQAYQFDLASDPGAAERYQLAFHTICELPFAPQISIFWAPVLIQERPPTLAAKIAVVIALAVVVARAAVDLWEFLRWHFVLPGGLRAYCMILCGIVLGISFEQRKLRIAAGLIVIANGIGFLLRGFGASLASIREAAPAAIFADLLAMVLIGEAAVQWLKKQGLWPGEAHA